MKTCKNHSAILFLLCILFLTLCMLLYPEAAYQGACNGIHTWATHLLPSLLPFFIAANLLISLGFVQFLGVLLEPVMRPLFRLPGEAGLAVALGFTSGFPMGAVLTASLYEQNLCTENEAARLAAFTNNSSPLFLLIAVPVSMLHMPQIGILLLSAHYTANIIIGIILRFTAVKTNYTPSHRHPHILIHAITQMRQYQKEHVHSIGSILGQAIQKGLSGIFNIGGFVLFFSVLLSMLNTSGLFQVIDNLFQLLLGILHISPQLSGALASGLFEMTLGAQNAAECETDLLMQLMVISFILGWSGLSIQAQVCSILSAQQISAKMYCLCRPLQGILAALLIPVFITCCPWMLSLPTAQSIQTVHNTPVLLTLFSAVPILALMVLALLLFISLIIHCLKRIIV